MYIIPDEFKQFISLSCDRASFIQDYLAMENIKTYILPIEGKNHIYVNFPKEQYNTDYKIKTVIAHYDRVPDSPGANDNSVAVFCMMEWAKKLINSTSFHNIRMIFTDGEESSTKDVSSQGAYALAKLFVKLNINNDDVFIFDCMGRGTIPVISKIDFASNVSKSFINRFNLLEKKMAQILYEVTGQNAYNKRISFSDNAGFLANGIPCCTVTMLPLEEINQTPKPYTWELLHTIDDNLLSLWPESFKITLEIFDLLSQSQFYS